MEQHGIETILLAYFSGQATEEEKKELLQWLEAGEANKKRMAEMADWWAMSHIPLFASDREAGFRKYFADLATTSQMRVKRKTFGLSFAGKIAAAVLLLLLVGTTFYYVGKNTQAASREIASYETVVPYGSKTKVILPDRSIVWINAGSTLTYSDNVAGNQREVLLEGEAYFEVTPDPLKPFIVKAGTLDVEVLGTSFDVRAYKDEQTIDVVLLTGKVDVYLNHATDGHRNADAALSPNQMLSYNRETNDIHIAVVHSPDYSAWKDGQIKFSEQSFTRIARDLERRYNIEIEINSAYLKKEIFTGSFSEKHTITDILKEIDVDRKYKWKQTGTKYIIRDK
ncbi:MAG: FecR domain-containing protein [Tannerellaceae bacterium]|jgi:ferric-dicitrate binding protein FerR (iron transport regulator)|nr:FecR domain-containing protein [Tannerellaceae bacterium]